MMLTATPSPSGKPGELQTTSNVLLAISPSLVAPDEQEFL
jgi:hypothetical protein